MLRQSSDLENSGDYNWYRLWERPTKKAHRRVARAWLLQLSSDLPSPKALVVPDQPIGPSDFVIMISNPTNQSLEDQFLRWRQDMEVKEEEQARQIAELQGRADHLQQENDCLWARLEGKQIKNASASDHPAPLIKQNKGKEPIRLEGSDTTADDELSSGSSPLSDLTPSKNNAESESRKRPPRWSS